MTMHVPLNQQVDQRRNACLAGWVRRFTQQTHSSMSRATLSQRFTRTLPVLAHCTAASRHQDGTTDLLPWVQDFRVAPKDPVHPGTTTKPW